MPDPTSPDLLTSADRPALIADQPPPVPNVGRPIWELVIADMHDRDRLGRARYGVPLQAHNGRDPLVDAYQEALDLAVYLRQAIEERTEGEARYVRRISDLEAMLAHLDERGRLGMDTHDAIRALLDRRLA